MSESRVVARVTPRQAALIVAVAQAEGITESELLRRAISGYIFGTLEIVNTVPQPPAVLRLHDFPRIAHSLQQAHEADLARLSGRREPSARLCPECGRSCIGGVGLSAHRRAKHPEAA